MPQPASTYDQALEQFAALRARDGSDVQSLCASQLLTHGQPTERVIVLIHGMTNCPRQYIQLAPLFFDKGYNVLIPRQPRNGLADANTNALAHLSLAELVDSGHRAVDIARGLGQHVTVVGISAGGTLAAWIAQNRDDVDIAVPIAPLFGLTPSLPIFNTAANVAIMRLLQVAPNLMTQRIKPFVDGPPQSYRGFATRGLATAMRFGWQVYRAAATQAPRAHAILMMLNPNDPAVNNDLSLAVLRRWSQRSKHVELFMFDGSRKLIHDVIDPTQRDQQTDYTYPILVEQITGVS